MQKALIYVNNNFNIQAIFEYAFQLNIMRALCSSFNGVLTECAKCTHYNHYVKGGFQG